jgi:hypothetical protein
MVGFEMNDPVHHFTKKEEMWGDLVSMVMCNSAQMISTVEIRILKKKRKRRALRRSGGERSGGKERED